MKKWILIVVAIIFAVLTVMLCWTFFSRARMDYNEEGNYFDQNIGIVYHEQAVLVYGVLAFISASLTVLCWWKCKNFKK
ncbi:MAG: hypothetical protein RL660_1741 [Bacteroidota bacterium]|jgi:flagellar basal body-associated protein FliL